MILRLYVAVTTAAVESVERLMRTYNFDTLRHGRPLYSHGRPLYSMPARIPMQHLRQLTPQHVNSNLRFTSSAAVVI